MLVSFRVRSRRNGDNAQIKIRSDERTQRTNTQRGKNEKSVFSMFAQSASASGVAFVLTLTHIAEYFCRSSCVMYALIAWLGLYYSFVCYVFFCCMVVYCGSVSLAVHFTALHAFARWSFGAAVSGKPNELVGIFECGKSVSKHFSIICILSILKSHELFLAFQLTEVENQRMRSVWNKQFPNQLLWTIFRNFARQTPMVPPLPEQSDNIQFVRNAEMIFTAHMGIL